MTDFDMIPVMEKIQQLNEDNITRVVKRKRGGEIRNILVVEPDKEKALEMINKFVNAIKETGFNASFLDLIKIDLLGSPEHFIRVRVGNCNYYLSELGLDSFIRMAHDKWTTDQLRTLIKKYGIRNTASAKANLQHIVTSDLNPLCKDYKEQYYKFMGMTEKELHIYCVNTKGVKKCGKMSIRRKKKEVANVCRSVS